ncbi:MAG: hypothetical protein AB1391_02510 [Candidatus Micrarchaeota archaeon]
MLVIGGHGTPTSICLTDDHKERNYIDIFDKNVLDCICNALDKDNNPQIILESCSTGNKATQNNIAKIISKNTGAEVFAPDLPTFVRNISFKIQNNKPRIQSVEYRTINIETRYKEGKLSNHTK